MSIFTEKSTVGRLLNQEWDSHRQAKHMAKQLEKTNEAKERAAQERAHAEAQAEAKYESAKKDVIKYRTQFYAIIDKIETVFDATDDEFYMREAFSQAIADDLFALPTIAEMNAIREKEARIATEKKEVARVEALSRKEEMKAEMKANRSKHPMHWFKQLIAWATLIGGGGLTALMVLGSYAQYTEGKEIPDGSVFVTCFVFFTIPALLAVKALWFREYNRLMRAAKKA
jgi:hypothetical protein